jgi:tripartite-type tricarboxylate transporter receptor subunit TctC
MNRRYLSLSRTIGWLAVLAVLLPASGGFAPVHASDDWKNKTLTVYIPFPQAGGYDQYARLFARHVGRHLPGHPTVVPSNMPGANGLIAANFLYNKAPNDGTAIGFPYQAIAQDQVILGPKVQYDARKFSWIGRVTSTTEILYSWHRVPVRRIEDLVKREVIVAAAGPMVSVYAQLLNTAMGAKFKIVRGYKGTQQIHIALERGEVEAAYSSLSTIRAGWGHWLKNNDINILVQTVPQRHPDLPEVPAVTEFGKTASDKQVMNFFAAAGAIGRSVVAPPGVPAKRLETLQAAFWATMKDEQFLAEAGKLKLDVEPMAGDELRKIVETIVSVGPAERQRAIEMMK